MEMINTLTSGLGADLGRPIRRNYLQAESALRKHDSFVSLTPEKKQFAFDLLAITVFHAHVIVPLHCSANFLTSNRKFGVKQVKMSNYMLGTDHCIQVNAITKTFFAIMKAYGIDIVDLHIESTSEFIKRVAHWRVKDGKQA